MFSFDEIYGNELVISNLKYAISAGRVSHFYIFSGAKGLGKKLLAGALAKALECESGGVVSCNDCVSCKQFESGNHPDVIYVKPTKTKAVSVDDIREQVNRVIGVKPFKHPYKIFIIDNGETLTVAAQNALLKTIEEPPAYGVFIILTENKSAFLPTVLSRAVSLSLRPLSQKTTEDYLVDKQFCKDRVTAALYSMYSGGNIGLSLKLLEDGEFALMRQWVMDTLEKTENMDIATVYKCVNETQKYKERISEVLDMFYYWYRDVIIMKTTKNEKYLTQVDMKARIEKVAANSQLKTLYKKIEAIYAAQRLIHFNGNFQLTMEVLFLELKEK